MIKSCIFIACALTAPLAAGLDSPAYPNPAPNLDGAYRDCLPAADLLGFDLAFDGRAISTPVPEFHVGIPTEMTLYWVPRTADWTERTVRVSFKGTGPKVDREYPVTVKDWSIGGVCKQVCPIEIPRFTHVGSGLLTVSLSCSPEAEEGAECKLYLGPSLTHQIKTTSTFSEERIREAFGPGAVRLKAAFRLAPGARLPLQVGDALDKPCTGIAVISALSHSYRFEQGEPVVRIEAVPPEPGARQFVTLNAGEHTSLSEYDVPRPGALKMKRTEIIESKPHPGERLTWDMKPLQLHTYVARLPLQKPVQPDWLEITYLSKRGVIDIYDIILLTDGDVTPEGAP
ncbi:MAG: hypothetical protein QG656_984 [Candidatus Hydrogenedentes bacterium]|nr:hypothetical protein [Candidatus Hydrogenedentota bacterium]